jgi:hypothetical protein
VGDDCHRAVACASRVAATRFYNPTLHRDAVRGGITAKRLDNEARGREAADAAERTPGLPTPTRGYAKGVILGGEATLPTRGVETDGRIVFGRVAHRPL